MLNQICRPELSGLVEHGVFRGTSTTSFVLWDAHFFCEKPLDGLTTKSIFSHIQCFFNIEILASVTTALDHVVSTPRGKHAVKRP